MRRFNVMSAMRSGITIAGLLVGLWWLGGCAPRAYVVSPALADREGRMVRGFASPTAVGSSSGAPDKVPSPEDRLLKAGSQPATDRAASSLDFTSAIDAQGRSTEQNPEPEARARTAVSTEVAVSAHSFSGNETEHVSFSKYNPFGANDSFELVLDGLAYTYPIAGKFSSGYGARGRSMHSGVDLVAPASTPIYAVFDGVVRLSKPYSGYGNVIVLRHKNGLETVYSHNAKNLVRVGQQVAQGDQIALCGRTGRATTNHLHFEVRVQGATINPTLLLDVQGRTLQAGVLRVSRSSGGAISARRNNSNKEEEPNEKIGASPQLAATQPEPKKTTTPPAATQPVEERAHTSNPEGESTPVKPAAVNASRGIRVGDQIYQAPAASDTPKTSPSAVYHTVARGETLSHIALKYKTSWQAISKVNGWTSKEADRIRAGDKIRVK